ncbi:MAG: polyprenyl synthetase family protein [Candidatus Cloacimonetes bacterium]|nr:polyprenyl synthetase family protein [Candidatus Cloacimonadota bacterium]
MESLAKVYLKDYINKTNPIISNFFDQKIKEAAKISPITEQMMQRYKNFMSGGKRLRGALIKLGYECFGGQDERAILETSIAIEIIHSFLLMHDDIMDHDDLRRGQPTIHRQFQRVHEENYQKGDPAHYGTCLAIDLGDAGSFLAHEVLCNSSFPSKIKVRAIDLLNKILLNTAYGQALDVAYENFANITQADVMRVHTHKTAYYTVTGPLSLGATLAGAGERQIEKIRPYGQPVGIAFQIRDDILGLYSDEKTLGKPIDSDIRENKNTLLIVKAFDWANKRDLEFLRSHYGRSGLSREEIEKIRKIIKRTGSLEYSNKTGWELVEEGKSFIPRITPAISSRELLASFADFMMERES